MLMVPEEETRLMWIFFALAAVLALCSCSSEKTYSFTNPQCAFVDKKGNLKYWPKGLEALSGFHEGFAVYKVTESLTASSPAGFIGLDGIKHQSTWLFGPDSYLSSGLALVENPKSTKHCYIDVNGKKQFNNEYEACQPFSEGLAAVFIPDKTKSNKPAMDSPSSGMPNIGNGRWGYVNTNGKLVIPAKFASASSFSSGRARITLPEAPRKILVIDSTGKTVFQNSHDELLAFSKDGFAIFRNYKNKGGCDLARCGLVDRNGTIAINNRFFENFENGVGLLGTNPGQPLTFVNTGGQTVLKIEPKSYAWWFPGQPPSFSDGVSAVVIARYPQSNGKKSDLYAQRVFQLIDKEGKSLSLNTNGKVITSVYPFNDGYSVVCLSDIVETQ